MAHPAGTLLQTGNNQIGPRLLRLWGRGRDLLTIGMYSHMHGLGSGPLISVSASAAADALLMSL